MCHEHDGLLMAMDKVHERVAPEEHYQVSHLARLEFANPVSGRNDARATTLFRALSLMKGGWVGLVGLWQFGSNDELIKIVPYATKVVRSQGRTPSHESDKDVYGQVFDSLQSAFDDAAQREAIQTAFHCS